MGHIWYHNIGHGTTYSPYMVPYMGHICTIYVLYMVPYTVSYMVTFTTKHTHTQARFPFDDLGTSKDLQVRDQETGHAAQKNV